MMRRMLLGGLIAVAVCGAAEAKPPTGPLSEGRELDPVTRDFYHGQSPNPLADPAQTAPDSRDADAWPLLLTFTVLD